jgi:multicomponent Na+:H+ antiporter subunit D
VHAFAGLSKRMPYTTWAFLISGLSLIGVPLTVGFVSKWYLLQAAFSAGHWYVGFLIVGSSLIALLYIGRIAEMMLLREPATEGPYVMPAKDEPLSMLIPMWVLVAANIYFGFNGTLTGDIAARAAEALMYSAGGTP